MWDRLCLCLPTYKRSDKKLPECLNSIISTADRKDQYHICAMVNTADLKSRDTVVAICKLQGVSHEVLLENSPKPSLAYFYNTMSKATTVGNLPGAAIAMIGDDMVFHTKGWDSKILLAINRYDGVGMFYCSGDDRFNDGLAVNHFITRKFLRLCGGQWMCPAFHANGIDVVWQKMADATDNDYYLENVVIEHRQWSRENVGHDETSTRMTPMRMKAIRDKDLEAAYAMKLVRTFGGNPSRVVPHLEHKRPGRHVIHDDGEYTYRPDGSLVLVRSYS